MVDKAVEITGCDREGLLNDLRAVHQKHHDSEHPFSLLETSFIRSRLQHPAMHEITRSLDPAFHAYNSTRKRPLVLHPGVRETLDLLAKTGLKLVAQRASTR